MKYYYEMPTAEVIDFRAREDLAVIPEGSENIGPEDDGSVGSRDF